MNQENSKDSGLLIIGKDISWEAMLNGRCRVRQFTPFACVTKEEPQSFKVVGQVPYASLGIEILINYDYPFTSGFLSIYMKDLKHLPTKAIMPIWNKVDFINLWEVFREAEVTVQGLERKEAEVIVIYKQHNQSDFNPDIPSLTIEFCTAGSLENIVFTPPTTTYPRVDTPKALFEWDENRKEEYYS